MAYADMHFEDDVERALATLPPDFRAAVVLCDVEGLTYEEIAEILGAKLGTVRSRIHRGRAQLRAALAHRAPAEGRRPLLRPAHRAALPCRAARDGSAGTSATRVSALLDGQLSAEDEERAWDHVHACHLCRDLVEREGWVKTRLAGLSFDAAEVPSTLRARCSRCPDLTPGEAYLASDAATRGRAGSRLVALGSGAAGAAVMGVLALGAAPADAPTRTAGAVDQRQHARPRPGQSAAAAAPSAP